MKKRIGLLFTAFTLRNNVIKKLPSMLLLAMILPAGSVFASDADKVKISPMPVEVLYDARKIQFDVAPKMMNDSVFVPIRFISDKLGGKLTLKGKSITVVRGSNKLELTIGSAAAKVNGKPLKLRVPVMVEKGRTLVPLQVVNPGLGVPVEWDAASRYVWIGKKEVPSVDDIGIKPKDIKPYLSFYTKDPTLLDNIVDDVHGTFKTVLMLSEKDLPVRIDKDLVIYDLHRAKVQGDTADFLGIRQSYAGTTYTGTHTALLTSDNKARFRSNWGAFTRHFEDGTKAAYYKMYDQGDKYAFGEEPNLKITLEKVKYIQIKELYNKSLILIQNPYVK